MSFPSIPDSVNKLLTLLGIVLFGFATITDQNQYNIYSQRRIEYLSEVKRMQSEYKILNEDLKEIGEHAEYYSKKFNISNPIKVSDTGYLFIRTFEGDSLSVSLTDTINNLLKQYNAKEREISIKEGELDSKKIAYDETQDDYKEFASEFVYMMILAISFFGVGLLGWAFAEIGKEKLMEIQLTEKQRESLSLPTFSEFCQSCARRFNCIVKYGTEADGKINYHFCNSCYNNGSFTEPDLTVHDVINETTKKLKERKVFRLKRWLIKKRIESLHRWMPSKY